MKKTALIIAGILMLCPTLLKAQQPEDGVARHAVKANILSPLTGCPSISYEFRIASHSAVQVDCGGTIFKSWDKTMTPHYYFADAHYRFYLVKQGRRNLMPFVGAGVHYTNAWENFDMFVRNDGWDIVTERYTLRNEVVRPFFTIGLKVNIPFGLTIESAFGARINYSVDANSPLAKYDPLNTLFTTRIGWAF